MKLKIRSWLLIPLFLQALILLAVIRFHGSSASLASVSLAFLLTFLVWFKWQIVEADAHILAHVVWKTNLWFFSEVAIVLMYLTGVVPFGLVAKAFGKLQIESSFESCRKRRSMFVSSQSPSQDFLRQS